MGEYVRRGKQVTKIGSCENLYYTTFKMFWHYAKIRTINEYDSNCSLKTYIQGEFRFRFPFADENHIEQFGNYEDHDFKRGLLFSLPKTTGIEMCHDNMFYRTSNQVNNKNLPDVGFRLPCIQSKEFAIKKFDCYNTNDNVFFEVTQQKPVLNKLDNTWTLQTVIRCPYCGECSRLDYNEALSLFSHVWKNRKHFTYVQIAATIEILRGYIVVANSPEELWEKLYNKK